MAARTESYVDPSIDADTGAGTSTGDPAGDLQGWLNRMGRDTTNGDRINIKAGTDEILTAAVSLTTYGTPTTSAPLTLQGYASVAGDLGVGGISGDGSFSVFSTAAMDYVSFVDLHLHNCGSSAIILLDDNCFCIRCELDGTSGNGWDSDLDSQVLDSYFHDIGGIGVNVGTSTTLRGCYFKSGATNKFSTAIQGGNDGMTIGNILSLHADVTTGIATGGSSSSVIGNSVLSAAGTGKGIDSGNMAGMIEGNIVEGFSGTGGQGYLIDSSAILLGVRHNAAYNNTTDYTSTTDVIVDEIDNEVNADFSVSPFAKSGADSFANRFIYFAPVSGGNVIGGLPNGQDKGAVQSVPDTAPIIISRPRRVI